jgi:hypothetical protein
MRTRALSLGVAAIALVAVMTACGGDDDSSSAPTTTTTTATTSTTTSPPDCTLDGATERSTTGDQVLEPGAPAALLRNVQVEASACADAVVLSFWRGTPGYTVEYRDGPFTADPSGKPVPVPGTAFLAIHLFPAAGVDLTSPDATPTYVGEPVFTPVPPSAISELHQLGDFESVNTWVIGLDERRPFTVERTPTTLVVTIAATTARAATCAIDGVTVTLPEGWYADVAGPDPCQRFDPAPFAIEPQTDSVTWAVRVETSSTGFDEAVSRWSAGDTSVVRSSKSTTIDGHRAVVVEVESNGVGLAPAGWRSYAYVVDRAPGGSGSVTIVVASTQPGTTYDTRTAGADEIAANLKL